MKRITKKQVKKNEIKKEETEKMFELFLEIWRERKHYSEISGKWLGKEPLSTFFHHILPKRRFEELKFEKENIILLTPDEHQKVEQDIYFFEKINQKREELIKKYDTIN